MNKPMQKVLTQALIMIAVFFSAWFVLAQVDWLTILKVQENTDKLEEKLGELYWDIFKKIEKENNDTFVINAVDSIVAQICSENGIERSSIKVHILNKDDVNAFALPDGHLVIFSGLILASGNQEELSGVICHEIAHLELNHVMKKLIKEVGFSVLISMTSGSGGSDVIRETAKLLSSTAFDRNLEKEADLKAVDYLIKAKINPAPFAEFLYKLSESEHEFVKHLTWMSTHPDSKERAAYMIEYCGNRPQDFKSLLKPETWEQLKQELQD